MSTITINKSVKGSIDKIYDYEKILKILNEFNFPDFENTNFEYCVHLACPATVVDQEEVKSLIRSNKAIIDKTRQDINEGYLQIVYTNFEKYSGRYDLDINKRKFNSDYKVYKIEDVRRINIYDVYGDDDFDVKFKFYKDTNYEICCDINFEFTLNNNGKASKSPFYETFRKIMEACGVKLEKDDEF